MCNSVALDGQEKPVEIARCFPGVCMALAKTHSNADVFLDGEDFYVNKVELSSAP